MRNCSVGSNVCSFRQDTRETSSLGNRELKGGGNGVRNKHCIASSGGYRAGSSGKGWNEIYEGPESDRALICTLCHRQKGSQTDKEGGILSNLIN